LFYGKSNLLQTEKEDVYFKDLKTRYDYLQHKYQLEDVNIGQVQFFKHRPDNFPTIRLSQLADLYHKHQNLFSKLIQAKSLKAIYDLLDVSASAYWQTHYQFDKVSPKKSKSLSKSFINLLLINTIIPFLFAYEKRQGKETSEENIYFLEQISPEKNVIIDKFKSIGIASKNAFETQSLLQLKNEYCNKSRCLQCAIGIELLKN
jgi:Protein of unknown function (DUF2851)